jgi:phosphoenolpyruvate-protein kinase (PTS system EI component)
MTIHPLGSHGNDTLLRFTSAVIQEHCSKKGIFYCTVAFKKPLEVRVGELEVALKGVKDELVEFQKPLEIPVEKLEEELKDVKKELIDTKDELKKTKGALNKAETKITHLENDLAQEKVNTVRAIAEATKALNNRIDQLLRTGSFAEISSDLLPSTTTTQTTHAAGIHSAAAQAAHEDEEPVVRTSPAGFRRLRLRLPAREPVQASSDSTSEQISLSFRC